MIIIMINFIPEKEYKIKSIIPDLYFFSFLTFLFWTNKVLFNRNTYEVYASFLNLIDIL